MMTVIEKQYMDAVIAMNRRMQKNEIDWEQCRYEIAKEIFFHKMKTSLNNIKDDAENAVELADLLISELKKEK